MRIDTKFDVGDLVTEKGGGFKNRKVTRIEIWTDDPSDELINYTVEGAKDSLLEHELKNGGECPCGCELEQADVEADKRDADGFLLCRFCVRGACSWCEMAHAREERCPPDVAAA